MNHKQGETIVVTKEMAEIDGLIIPKPMFSRKPWGIGYGYYFIVKQKENLYNDPFRKSLNAYAEWRPIKEYRRVDFWNKKGFKSKYSVTGE